MKKLLSLGLLSCFAAYATEIRVCFTMDNIELNATTCLAENCCASCENEQIKIDIKQMETTEANCMKLQCTVCKKNEDGSMVVLAEPVMTLEDQAPAQIAVANADSMFLLSVEAVK